MTCPIRISVPRTPKRRITGDFYKGYGWRDWVNALLSWSQTEIVDGKFVARPIPRMKGPCSVQATVRWDSGANSPAVTPERLGWWREGIGAALKQSRIATDITGIDVSWEPVDVTQTGTDIVITATEIRPELS